MFTTKTKVYRQTLEHARRYGHVVSEDPNGKWFIDFGYPVDEIAENYGGVLYLHVREYKHGAVCRANLVYCQDKKEMLLGDIKSRIENKGYGAIMMRSIIKLSKKLGVKKINGNISDVDKDHFGKLKHFYEKLGFTFQLGQFEHGYVGRVVLKLH